MAGGNRFCVISLSPDYGERRYAVEDLSIMRDNIVREWRTKGIGRTHANNISKSKKGMIWRGTRQEAEELCEALNKSAKLGTMSVASDPPIRENARHYARTQNAKKKSTTAPIKMENLFTRCEPCKKMVKKGHTCPTATK
jgi:hypothetical protein